jgi:hypothetical protein
MPMKYLYKHTPEIILLIYVGLFLGFKNPEQPWDRVINSDGKGYYAYLPAIFIYHDLRFSFIDQYESQYYPSNRSVFKEFRNPAGQSTVNKYFPGLAIILLPFFLLGHLIAWLEQFPMDGYSLPYQYTIAVAALFFLWLGARWLQKVLIRFGSAQRTAAFLTLTITLGTNLIFFTIVEGSMSHVYSFALITGFIYTTFNFFHHYQPKWFVKSLLLFILIVMIRPTNGLIIMLVPFVAGSNAALMTAFRKAFTEPFTLLRGGIQAAILVSIPFILWKQQTGQWLVYTYGEEHLQFLSPHAFNILFSFNRGWFIYTPIALVSLAGLVGLFRQNRYRFFWLVSFLIVFIYVASCWWVWYYASKCGQRVFIDLYVVVGLLLMFLYNELRSNALKHLLSALLALLISLNIVQFYQHTRWIFPPTYITAGIFKDSFMSLHQQARSYLPAEGMVAVNTISTDMESDQGWMNGSSRSEEEAHQGQWSSRTDTILPYSLGAEKQILDLFTTRNRIVQVEAWVLSPKTTTEATLVADFQIDGKSVSYNPFYLEKFVRPDHWTRVQSAFYLPTDFPNTGTVKIYFFNPSKNVPFYVDDLKIEFISMKDKADYRKIEGVVLPEHVNR